MSADFIGLTVLVKLKSPPVTLQGLVAVVQGQRLFLKDVLFHASGKRLKEYVVHGLEIEDIEVAKNEPFPETPLALQQEQLVQKQQLIVTPSTATVTSPPPMVPQPPAPRRPQHAAPSSTKSLLPPQLRPPKNFVDPAILSFTRVPAEVTPTALTSALPTQFLATESNENEAKRLQDEDMEQMITEMEPDDRLKETRQKAHEEKKKLATAEKATNLLLPVKSDAHANSKHHNAPSFVQASAELGKPDGHHSHSTHFDYLLIDNKTHQVDQAEVVVTAGDDESSRKASAELEVRPLVAEVGLQSASAPTRRRQRPSKKRPTAVLPASSNGQASPEIVREADVTVEAPPDGWRRTPILQDQPRRESPVPLHRSTGAMVGTSSRNSSGWRQTPILHDLPTRNQFNPSQRKPESLTVGTGNQPGTSNKRRNKRDRRETKREAQNGWATEDATDVQEMGDFDFAGNLSMFDKRAVFDQLREADTTADEDRLVSFNRVKPGTFGGKNLHPTENVLDRPRTYSKDLTLSGSLPEDEIEMEGSITSSRLRADYSRSSTKQQPSRKSSAFLAGRPTLRYAQTGQVCHAVNPETVCAIEELASVQLGIGEDLLAENAGRGIAEVALSAINPGGRRLHANHNAQPIIVFLCGETDIGSRALAAARHLQDRGVRVIATVPGPIDYAAGPLSVQLQRLGGKALRNWKETAAYLKTLDAPPELIVDALNGSTMATPFAHPDPVHAATAVEMMGWANKSKAGVLAVERPSGVDVVTGEVEVWEGEPAEVRAKLVVCLAAPSLGLLRAMELRGNEDGWRVSVVDVGLGLAGRLYMRSSTGADKRRGAKGDWVRFGAEWVVGLVFDAGSAAAA